jgi:hypothetical protein
MKFSADPSSRDATYPLVGCVSTPGDAGDRRPWTNPSPPRPQGEDPQRGLEMVHEAT